MPTLLDELVEETSASNRRWSERLAAETRELDEQNQSSSAHDEISSKVLETARLANAIVFSTLTKHEALWQGVPAQLHEYPENAENLLNAFLHGFESARRLVQECLGLWQACKKISLEPERIDELLHAASRYQQWIREVELALNHRSSNWQPADPVRFAQGLQLAREGKTIKSDEARSWFRQAQG